MLKIYICIVENIFHKKKRVYIFLILFLAKFQIYTNFIIIWLSNIQDYIREKESGQDSNRNWRTIILFHFYFASSNANLNCFLSSFTFYVSIFMFVSVFRIDPSKVS